MPGRKRKNLGTEPSPSSSTSNLSNLSTPTTSTTTTTTTSPTAVTNLIDISSDLTTTPRPNKHIRFSEELTPPSIPQPSITPQKRGRKKQEVIVEERAARTRKRLNNDIRKRIERALSQRLYLLDQHDISTPGNLGRCFSVLGSTGNTYHVTISKFPSCTCPDFENGNLCKHILFVYLRVLRCPETSPIICQDALLQDELASLFVSSTINKISNKNTTTIPSTSLSLSSTSSYNNSNHRVVISLVDSESEAEIETKAEVGINKNKGLETESDKNEDENNINLEECECPICFEEMKSKKESIEKCLTCKNYLHSDCLRRWLKQSKTCVYCRSPWITLTNTTNSFSFSNSNSNHQVYRNRNYL